MNQNTSWDQHWHQFEEALNLNPAQEFRRRLILSLISRHNISPASVFMDVGCGAGELLMLLEKHYPQGTFLGLDGSAQAIKLAQQNNPRAQFYPADFMASPWAHNLPPIKADVIICSEVLEHLDHPQQLLETLSTFLQSHGTLLVTVPGGPQSVFDRHIGHRRHYSLESLKGLCHTAGYLVKEINGVGFPIFNLYRCVVVARGAQLVRDVLSGHKKQISPLAKMGMRLFSLLFKLPRIHHPWGWQRYGVLKRPPQESEEPILQN